MNDSPLRNPWIRVCVLCVLFGGHLQLAESFTWTHLPLNPTKVIKGSTASLPWGYYKEEHETLNYIEFRRIKDGATSDTYIIGQIASDGAITVYLGNINLTARNVSAILNIHGTKREDQATYCCKIRTSKASETCIQLRVLVPPKLDVSPKNKTVNETESLAFFCNATGIPAPNISWTKVGSDKQLSQKENLVIDPVRKEDSGIYMCRASSEAGNETAKAFVNVQYKPRNTKLLSTAVMDTVTTDGSVTFNCSTDANPLAHVFSLYHENSLIAQNASFTIERVIWSDRGTYTCVPANFLGTAQNASITLTVFVPPQLDISPRNQTVNESDTLLVFCNASGNPAPNITWTKVGMTGPPIATGNTMKIANVSHEKHAGIYTCNASNGIGKNRAVRFKVTVHYRPTITLWSQTVGTWINQTTELFCLVEGIPTPNVSWPRSGAKGLETINQTHVISKFTIIPRKPRDFGAYTCEAINILGTQKQSMNLVQLTPPGKPVISVESGTNDIQVHWTPPADGGRPITSYTVQVKKTEGDEWRDCKDIKQKDNKLSCSFTDVESGTKYVVRVIAVNEIGHSEPATKEITTDASATSRKGRSKKVMVDSIITASASFGGIVVLVLFGVIFYCKYKRDTKKEQKNKSEGVFIGNWVDLPLDRPRAANIYASYQNPGMADVEHIVNTRYQETSLNTSGKGKQIMVDTFPQTMPPHM